MREWLQYFFGTPRRFLITAAFIGLIVVMISPGLLATAVARFINEMMPLIGPALTVLIVFAGIRLILFGRSGGGRGK
ncbi:MAG TPA: hypothetical protein VJC12_03245 [Candidatus Paceibacterota bacterium]